MLKSEAMQAQVITWVEEFFPVGADYVTQNIESLLRLRGPLRPLAPRLDEVFRDTQASQTIWSR